MTRVSGYIVCEEWLMQTRRSGAIRALCVAFVVLVAAGSATAAEITLLTAATIRTMDSAHPRAEALAFDGSGAIVGVGTQAELIGRYPRARRIDAGSATIVPGLIDAHGHVLGLGLAELRADLTGTSGKAEIIERLQSFAKRLGKDEWLLGRGWDQNDWDAKEFPTAADLDEAFPDRPVWLTRVDGHAGWANSAAMKRSARTLAGDWQPDGGRIVRNDAGEATGIFVDSAEDLIGAQVPALDAAGLEKALSLGMQRAVEHGLTGVHDAGVSLPQMEAYQRLADRDALPLRITAMADGDGAALDWLCGEGLYRHDGGRLKMRTVKVYADGALGSRGAALLVDYSDDPHNRGLMVTSPDGIAAVTAKARRCGVQVATHAIGDRGNREVLDAYAAVLESASTGDHRWRIEHAQVLAPVDLPRLAQLHVIASMQPTHATSDMPWAEKRVGPERIVGAYAWRQLRDSGARLALGSDFPVESVDPRLGLYSAATRSDGEGMPSGGWMPQEKLSAFEALRGFTLDAAFAGFSESEVGSLAVGKRADFAIFEEDPLTVDPRKLRTLTLRATYVDGKPVYEAPR